jgi:hypothetical protein
MANIHRIQVVDGPTPEFTGNAHEPGFETAVDPVLEELLRREPIFHRREFGLDRSDFERMTAPEFWEVGASGRRYSRQFVIDSCVWRFQNQEPAEWEIHDPACSEIAAGNYLFTYTLVQGARVTRRSTIWRRAPEDWQIVFHQGTEVV